MTMADTVAVMNAGRIEQLGRRRSSTSCRARAFVANFLGQSNLVARHGDRAADGAASGSTCAGTRCWSLPAARGAHGRRGARRGPARRRCVCRRGPTSRPSENAARSRDRHGRLVPGREHAVPGRGARARHVRRSRRTSAPGGARPATRSGWPGRPATPSRWTARRRGDGASSGRGRPAAAGWRPAHRRSADTAARAAAEAARAAALDARDPRTCSPARARLPGPVLRRPRRRPAATSLLRAGARAPSRGYPPAFHWQNYTDALAEYCARSSALVPVRAAWPRCWRWLIGYPMAYVIAVRCRRASCRGCCWSW